MDPLAAALIAVEENADKLRGATGEPGKRGVAGKAGDPGLEWRGPWAPSDTYAPGDAVELDGSSYVATLPSKNQRPPTGVWDLLAQKGAPGPPGRRGGGGGNAGGAGATDHGALTGLADNDHPQYTTDAEATTLADASVATHAAAGNPHPTYLTQAEGDAAYIPQGGPLTEDLDVGEFSLTHASGSRLSVSANILADAAGGADSSGGSFSATGGVDDDGGLARLQGGDGSAEDGARVEARGGTATDAGRVSILTNGADGDSGDVLTAQGDGTALWVPPSASGLTQPQVFARMTGA